MTITCTVASQPIGKVKADLVAVPVFAKRVLGPGAGEVDRALGGALARFMNKAGFEGKPGETLMVPVAGMGAKTALLVGVGARDEVSAATLRRAGASIARRATSAASVATTVASAASASVAPEAAAYALAEGTALGAYQYLAFKTKGEPTKLRRVMLVGDGGSGGGKAVTAALARARVVTDAVAWARDIVNEPSLTKSPADFAASAKRLLAGKGVTVTVLTESQIRAQKMGGVIGVGQGSERPPRFVKVVYAPPGGKARGTLALVGKGVTFDTGGISIKPADGMEAMKTDMGGAAAALGAMSTLEALGVRHRVVSYTPMVENMPSGNAIRPGDVLRMRDGQTVEVLNTDAEGRLILADELAWAVDEKPDAIVDLATLTGACVVALGEKVAGLMGNDDSWSAQVQAAADRAGEPMWHLPLPDDYRKNLESEVADLRNISNNRYGGALTAGLFLEAFVDDRPWVHLDIAGPARASADDGELARGGTGFGVRTLVELARTFEPPQPKKSRTKKSGTKKKPTTTKAARR
ncbi:MAG: leucyl aminopeptidase [Acidimicrobiia bacterium]|nr:leucyl aminopeptidase [Acidimicrobiia bacterium]